MMADKLCPLLKKPCIEHQCKFWVHLLGQNPQSAGVINNWDCSIAWLPILLIEGAQQTRQAGAAIESFRNEMVRGNQQTQMLLGEATTKLIGGNSEDYDITK